MNLLKRSTTNILVAEHKLPDNNNAFILVEEDSLPNTMNIFDLCFNNKTFSTYDGLH